MQSGYFSTVLITLCEGDANGIYSLLHPKFVCANVNFGHRTAAVFDSKDGSFIGWFF